MTVPPEFWTTIQRCGPTGASQFNWRHQAGPAYSLLKPFLAFRPEPLVCTVLCHQCHRIRDVSNPYDNVYILEQPEDCDSCVSDRTIKREDLLRTSLNGQKFAAELAKALEYEAHPLPEQLPPANLIQMGSIRQNGLSLPVVLMLTHHVNAVNLDAAFPTSETRVILHLEMEAALITALQHRHFIPIHLPSLIRPMSGGTFSAQVTLAKVLTATSIPAVAHASTLFVIHEKLDALPMQTAALMGNPPARKGRHLGEIIEPGFTASSGFRLIHFQGESYRLAKNPAAAILFIYHQMKELGWKKVPEEDILEEVYGTDRKKWPKNKNAQVLKLFRTGDAKRLRDAGFIVPDGEGFFSLSPKMHA